MLLYIYALYLYNFSEGFSTWAQPFVKNVVGVDNLERVIIQKRGETNATTTNPYSIVRVLTPKTELYLFSYFSVLQ